MTIPPIIVALTWKLINVTIEEKETAKEKRNIIYKIILNTIVILSFVDILIILILYPLLNMPIARMEIYAIVTISFSFFSWLIIKPFDRLKKEIEECKNDNKNKK